MDEERQDIAAECERRVVAERSFLLRLVLGEDWKASVGVTDTQHGLPLVRDLFLQKTAWVSPSIMHRFIVLERALKKLEEQSFGICDKCFEEISIGRLDANPCAIYCLACQTKIEMSSLHPEMFLTRVSY